MVERTIRCATMQADHCLVNSSTGYHTIFEATVYSVTPETSNACAHIHTLFQFYLFRLSN